MKNSKLWMRIVGGFYLLTFIVAGILRVPIRTLAPETTLDLAAVGDPVAKLLVDTWFLIGLDFAAIGVALLIASRMPEKASSLVWGVLCFEIVRGIGGDTYMLMQGYAVVPHVIWVMIHTVIIVTGLIVLRRSPEVKTDG